MVLGIVRILVFFLPKPSQDPTDWIEIVTGNGNGTIQSPLLLSQQAKVAFVLDWIGSIVPTFMGIYILGFFLLAIISLPLAMCCIVVDIKEWNSDCKRCWGAVCYRVVYVRAQRRIASWH